MLRVDFYESADGETIILTFPDGGLGVVDAHPSSAGQRPSIAELVRGKHVHFICLTHPHADHGVDLHRVFQSAASIGSFWHTVTDLHTLVYSITQHDKFPSPNNPLLEDLRAGWAKFLLELYRNVMEAEDAKPGFVNTLNADRKGVTIAGVEIAFFGPEQAEQTTYVRVFQDRIQRKHRRKPDENALSAIIALRYGGKTVLLGSDALLRNWKVAVGRYRKDGWPRASIFKVPHHGAENALSGRKQDSYLTLCRSEADTFSVLFAGDAKHPHADVFSEVRSHTHLACLANGLKDGRRTQANPLDLDIPGAFAVRPTLVCNPHLGFEIHGDGSIRQVAGTQCAFCAKNGAQPPQKI